MKIYLIIDFKIIKSDNMEKEIIAFDYETFSLNYLKCFTKCDCLLWHGTRQKIIE